MDMKRARVVVVEDEKIMSTYILTILRRLGILDLYAYENGATALRELPQIRPDLIISDIHMDPVNGFEMVRQLRAQAHPKLSSTPVIFLSIDSSASTVEEAMPLGAAGFVVKPPSLKGLEAKIESALTRPSRPLH